MMNLKLLLPFGVFIRETNVQRIVIETGQGSFGLLPQRRDCIAAIVPGILIYQCLAASNQPDGGMSDEVYVAIDAGILVKTGAEVVVSVRNAFAGTDLDKLHDTVEQVFMQEDSQEKQSKSVLQKMEHDFMRRLTTFQHGA